MNVMSSFTFKSLKAAPVRTAVTIAGIAFSAALMVAVMTTLSSSYDCLKRAEIQSNGNWITSVNLPADDVSRTQIDQAKDSDLLEDLATIETLKTLELNKQFVDAHGATLPLYSVSHGAKEVCGIKAELGNMPKSPDEVLLPIRWQKKQTVQIGDKVELAPKAIYTVSGFYLDDNNLLLVDDPNFGVIPAAITAASNSTEYPNNKAEKISVYLAFKDVKNIELITKSTELLFPHEKISYHSRLILFNGMTPPNEASYENGLEAVDAIVAILTVVIMLACISLIYNAFAISVNERMRQFGLLSSIGASKRQLRNSVLLECVLMWALACALGVGLFIRARPIATRCC